MTTKLQTEANHVIILQQSLDIMVLLLLGNRDPSVLLQKKLQFHSFSPPPWEPAKTHLEEFAPRSFFSVYCGMREVGRSTYQLFWITADQEDIQEGTLSGLNVAQNSANACWPPPCLLLRRQ